MSASVLPFNLTAQEQASFVGARYTIRSLAGVTLYRLLGRTVMGNWNSAFGQKCWFDEATFFDCVCDAQDEGGDRAAATASLRFLLRERLAVSATWNDFQSFVALRIPRGPGVTVAAGPAAAQPFMVDGRGPGRHLGSLILSGGATQYVISVGRDLSQWIVGPQALRVARA